MIFYLPNAFTPNGDENNNYFKPTMTSGLDFDTYHFEIYNRWGEKVFESNDVKFGWDGSYANQKSLGWVVFMETILQGIRKW